MHFEHAAHAYNNTEAKFLSPIKRIVRDYIACNFIFGADYELGDEDSLLDAGIATPASTLELTEFLNSTFAIDISRNEINANNFDTINRIAHFVSGKIAQTSVA